MTLTIKERMLLLTILPREGDIASLRIIAALRAALSLSEEEHAKFGIVIKGDQVQWNPSIPQESEIEIGPRALVMIADKLKELSEAKPPKLTEDFIPLWDKFVEK